METFFGLKNKPQPIYESSDELNTCLKKVHKLGLEIQSIQKDVIQLYDAKLESVPFSKAWNKIDTRLRSLLNTKEEIVKELDRETRRLEKLVTVLDPKGQIQNFFN